ncbi:MAG: NfeD family protein [Chloroflexi bacterium]|nr:NfeD family protein [Chloroflexota bacterium]
MTLPDFGLLNCFYFFLLMSGVLYALFLTITGGLHSIHIPSIDVDLSGAHLPGGAELPATAHVDIGTPDAHQVSLLSLSPITIAMFITSFGGIGLIATLGFGMDGGVSVVVAVIGSVIVGIISHFLFFYLFIAPQASSALKESDILGHIGEVTAPIPGNSVGEIAYVSMGERHTATARSADGTAIPRGATVKIEKMAGTAVIVRIHKEV